MKAGLSLARPTKTTGTTLLQKTVPHGARCPRIEPCPTQRADGRAAPPARRSGPERAAQTRPSGSRPGTFGPLTHRCERKPYSAPFGRNRHSLRPLHPLFRADSPQETPSPEERRNGERFLASFLHRFIQPSHPSEATAKRGASLPVGPDRGMPIKYRPFRSIRRPGSENRMFLPLTHYSDSGRISGVVFSYSPRTQRSPHRRTAPSENRTARAPLPPSYLRHRQGTRSVPPQQGHGKTGACPAADTAASAGPVSRFRIFPSRHARNVFRTAARRGAPHAGSLHLAGRLFRYRPSSPGPPRSSTKRYGKKRRPTPDPGGGNRTGNRRTGRGPVRTGADVFRHGEA